MLPFKVLEEKDHYEYISFVKGKLVYKIHWRFLYLFGDFWRKNEKLHHESPSFHGGNVRIRNLVLKYEIVTLEEIPKNQNQQRVVLLSWDYLHSRVR